MANGATTPVRGRKLPQYLVVYTGSCAGFLQLFDVTIERLHLHERYFTIAFIVCLLGIPLVVAAALLRELAARDSAARHTRAARRSIVGWAAIVLFLLVAAFAAPRAAAYWAGDDEITLRRGGAVLLAPFASRTADSALAAVLTDALAIDFERDPAVVLVDEARLRHVLALDGIVLRGSPSAEQSKQYAGSAGASAILEPNVERAGASYVLLARLLTPAGERLASVRTIADTPESLWGALDQLSTEMRSAAARAPRTEATGAIQPVAQTTLDGYAQALSALHHGDQAAAENALRNVVAADSTFVPALRTLGELLYARGDSITGRPLLSTARDRAEQATARERYLALAAYYQHVDQNPARAAVSYRRVLEMNPADSVVRARLQALRDSSGS